MFEHNCLRNNISRQHKSAAFDNLTNLGCVRKVQRNPQLLSQPTLMLHIIVERRLSQKIDMYRKVCSPHRLMRLSQAPVVQSDLEASTLVFHRQRPYGFGQLGLPVIRIWQWSLLTLDAVSEVDGPFPFSSCLITLGNRMRHVATLVRVQKHVLLTDRSSIHSIHIRKDVQQAKGQRLSEKAILQFVRRCWTGIVLQAKNACQAFLGNRLHFPSILLLTELAKQF